MSCMRGGIWKGDILVADIKELEDMDASELHARSLNAKEVLTPMKGDCFIFPVAERSGSENIHFYPGQPRRHEKSKKIFGENQKGSSSTPRQDSTWHDGEDRDDFVVYLWFLIYRHHVEPRVNLYVPTEE